MIKRITYYENAFNSDYTQIWQKCPIKFSTDDINELSYYRALGCFYSQDPQSLADRRELLYHYVSADFDIYNNESAINRYRTRMPINSMIMKVLKSVCTAYQTEPHRKFSENEQQNQRLSDIYKNSNLNVYMQDIYRQARHYGILAVRPIFINGNLKLQVLSPDRFRVITNDYNEVTDILYPTVIEQDIVGIDNYIFHHWNADNYTQYSDSGRIISQEPNRYNEIPFIFLKFGYTENFFSAGMYENIELQLAINNLRFIQQLNYKFFGSPIAIAVNGYGKFKAITPDKVIQVDDIAEDDGKIPPSLEFVTPDEKYLSLQELIETLEKDLQRKNGIPLSQIESGTGIVSGVSRIIERQELIELRQSDLPILRNFERDLCNMIVLANQFDNSETLNNIVFSIDFDEERLFTEPDIERASDYDRTKIGLMSPSNFIYKWGDFDSEVSDEDLITIFKERKDLFNKLFSNELIITENKLNDNTLNNEVENKNELEINSL